MASQAGAAHMARGVWVETGQVNEGCRWEKEAGEGRLQCWSYRRDGGGALEMSGLCLATGGGKGMLKAK